MYLGRVYCSPKILLTRGPTRRIGSLQRVIGIACMRLRPSTQGSLGVLKRKVVTIVLNFVFFSLIDKS